MYNFYPGPSRIYPAVKRFAQEAFESGILERNHRSDDFMTLLKECIDLLRDRLNVPADYKVFFTSSATECWEICAQSFSKEARFFYNGAFGEKWKIYTERINPGTEGEAFDTGEEPAIRSTEGRDVCLVANETSNGTAVSPETIGKIRAAAGDNLVMIDAVSSLGGVNYDISRGDIWISSSQKCLGLPSGMGIMLVSPAAQRRASEINDHRYYNSALFMESNFDRFQTPYTPNILAVYLLKHLLRELDNVSVIAERTARRAAGIYRFLEGLGTCGPLIRNEAVRSSTVVAVSCTEPGRLSRYLAQHGAIIGKGYGAWQSSTFRIANFPAIPDADYEVLFELLRSFVKL